MALSFKKDLEKYKDLDEDEILNNLSAEELKQLETALEEMDPEVWTQWGGLFSGREFCGKGNHGKCMQSKYICNSFSQIRYTDIPQFS